jgi:hypothetical protein
MRRIARTVTALSVALFATVSATASHALGTSSTTRPSWAGAITVPQVPGHFRHISSRMRAGGTEAWHRSQGVLVRAGHEVWVEARFGYGLGDNRLGDEDVDVYLRRADTGRWQLLGSTRTADHSHPVQRADGSMSNEKGLVAFRVPGGEQLPVGLHAIRFVVRGDRTVADSGIAVIGANARVAVSDVDGTLTEYEHAFGRSIFGLAHVPAPHPGAAPLLRSLAEQGYTIIYMTARPDFFSQATRQWLSANGFPPGLVRTLEGSHFGMGGPDGVTYKSNTLNQLARVLGHPVDIGFGNTITDVRAYEAGGIPAMHRFFYRYEGDARGGVHHEDYRVLAGRVLSMNQSG